MAIKNSLLILTIVIFIFADGAFSQIKVQQDILRNTEPQFITLYSQHKHEDFTKANFNFKLGVRGDSKAPRTWNNYDLRYGGFSFGNDSDWFGIPTDERSYSRIKDLGELTWNDIFDVPLLYASSVPHSGENFSIEKDKLIKITPENTMVKAVAGHIYLIHAKEMNYAKEIDRDLYAMFRVESLKPGDEVTISWKIVPSPEINND